MAETNDDEIIESEAIVPRVAGILGPYWFFFYSFDCAEPTHVHVRRERNEAKFWLQPVVVAWNRGFSPRELNEIRRVIIEHEALIIEAWDEHCGTDRSEDSTR